MIREWNDLPCGVVLLLFCNRFPSVLKGLAVLSLLKVYLSMFHFFVTFFHSVFLFRLMTYVPFNDKETELENF